MSWAQGGFGGWICLKLITFKKISNFEEIENWSEFNIFLLK